VRVSGAHDLESVPVAHEPSPPASDLFHADRRELLLECLQSAESFDLLRERSAWRGAALGLERSPVKGVIPRLPRVVEKLPVLGFPSGRQYDALEGLAFEFRSVHQLV